MEACWNEKPRTVDAGILAFCLRGKRYRFGAGGPFSDLSLRA
jgi:hypothetical protein